MFSKLLYIVNRSSSKKEQLKPSIAHCTRLCTLNQIHLHTLSNTQIIFLTCYINSYISFNELYIVCIIFLQTYIKWLYTDYHDLSHSFLLQICHIDQQFIIHYNIFLRLWIFLGVTMIVKIIFT